MSLKISNKFKNAAVLVLAFSIILNLIVVPHALAITFKEEQKIGDEVMSEVFKYYQEVTDPYVSNYINRLGYRLLGALNPQPFEYTFHVINDASYNAFAIPAGHIFVNSGLFLAMDKESELAGVMSHEIAHVTSRHISARLERSDRNMLLAVGGMLAAVLIGMSGDGDAAQTVAAGSLGAIQASELAYSRDDELQADQVGLYILSNNGYSPQGMMDILNKIRSKQWYGPKDFPTYLSSHPALEDRLAYIRTWMGTSDGRNVVEYNHDQRAFNYAKTRLVALYGDPKVELPKIQAALNKDPKDVDARYRYALLLNRNGQRNQAIEELSGILNSGLYDGYVLNDLGRIYFDSGNFEKAQELLEKAAPLLDNDPENRVLLGRIYSDEGQLDLAEEVLLKATRDFPNYAETYYFLANTVSKRGKTGWAHYYMAHYYLQRRDAMGAKRQLDLAYRQAGNDSELKRLAEENYNDLWRQQHKAGPDDEVRDPIGTPGARR